MRKNVEKQLLLDGQFCKPYPVAHVKFRRVQVPGWLNQGLSMSTLLGLWIGDQSNHLVAGPLRSFPQDRWS